MRIVVLDASAGVEIVLWTETGSRLAEHVAAVDEVVVPDHFHLECAAALRRLERRELSEDEAGAALERLLELRVRRVDTVPLVREAWVLRHNITIADAFYVVPARRLDVPLITDDGRLSRAPGLGVHVLTADPSPDPVWP